MQVAPPAREVILEVDQRIEDSTFANQLAVVLLSHINVLVAGLPGWCTACHAIHSQITIDTNVKCLWNPCKGRSHNGRVCLDLGSCWRLLGGIDKSMHGICHAVFIRHPFLHASWGLCFLMLKSTLSWVCRFQASCRSESGTAVRQLLINSGKLADRLGIAGC